MCHYGAIIAEFGVSSLNLTSTNNVCIEKKAIEE
jgi:hypothetical protein